MNTVNLTGLTYLQVQVDKWARKNFGEHVGPVELKGYRCLLGVSEEVGELCHAHLKAEQKIRNPSNNNREDAQDAIGDIIIYLMDYCAARGFDLSTCIIKAWNKVKDRDWKKYPENGVTK